MAFWRYNGDQNTIPTLFICPVCIVHSCKAGSFQRLFSKLTPLIQTCFRNHIIPSATVGLENFPNSLHRGTHGGGAQCVVSLLVLFEEHYPFPALTGWAIAVTKLPRSASVGATQQLWEQPKPQECQGDYWPTSNLLWSRGPLSSGDRFTFLTGLIKLSKSVLPAEGGLHSHHTNSIIKKAHVFKIKLFLTVSFKYLLFWQTFWFIRFSQAVMTLTLFFETLSFPLSFIYLLVWISSNEKRNRIYSKYAWGSSCCHSFLPHKTFVPHFNQCSLYHSHFQTRSTGFLPLSFLFPNKKHWLPHCSCKLPVSRVCHNLKNNNWFLQFLFTLHCCLSNLGLNNLFFVRTNPNLSHSIIGQCGEPQCLDLSQLWSTR